MNKRLSTHAMIFRSLLVLMMAFPLGVRAQEFTLPKEEVDALCQKYRGASAFVKDGQRYDITCEWVATLSQNKGAFVTSEYRRILAEQKTISNVVAAYSSGRMPSAKCQAPTPSNDRDGFELQCISQIGNAALKITYLANQKSNLVGVTHEVDAKRMIVSMLESSRERGLIDSFYEPYANLQLDIMLAKFRYLAGPGDDIAVNGGNIKVFISSPGK